MLLKTLQIRNVGRFDFSAAVDLAQATIVYAENGRGKTTLAAILRSLQTGEPLHILERKTIGATEDPQVSLLAQLNAKNSKYTFDGQVWSTTLKECEIFDSAFIAQNVYSGSEIDPEHRRHLHRFVLGATNVALAQKVDKLDDKVRTATQRIADAELAVQRLCLDAYTVNDFVKLKPHADIDTAIVRQEAVVKAARSAATITATQPFSELSLPVIDKKAWDSVLAKSLVDIEAQAEARVREHVTRHLREGAESWLAEGLSFTSGEVCPFCASDVSKNGLVRSYGSLFSSAYQNLKRETAAAATSAAAILSPGVLDGIRRAVATNAAVLPFWTALGIPCPEVPSLAAIEESLAGLADAYRRAFEQKTADILEPVYVGASGDVAWADLAAAATTLQDYDAAVKAANVKIQAVKTTAATNSLSTALQELRKLHNQRARHLPEAVAAVHDLDQVRAEKKQLEADKKNARDALEQATETLFKQYQDAINQHLANCGCGYSITGTKTVHHGGKPRTDYQLVINKQPVELSASKSGVAPCFKNTLSDGDKSTLAFAFFLARLGLDPQLSDKIVVFDDPMTSLDAHRRTYTCQQIVSTTGRCRQMILLTHDALFARQIWEGLPKQKKALQIADSASKSALVEWDILTATQADYFVRYERIHEFAVSGKGDALAVAQALRILLEGNLRMRFPKEFSAKEWLGDFIKKIRDAKADDPLAPMQSQLTELEALNDYSKQFHHDQNSTAGTVKPADAELSAYAKRTLAFTAGA